MPPLLSSPFRPFYFLGTLCAIVLSVVWLGAFSGRWGGPLDGIPLHVWHGHEMLFGFAAAIIIGILLTALPSWAGSEEIRGGRLAVLALLWLAGRAAFWTTAALPPLLAPAIDLLLLPAASLMALPGLLRVDNRLYLLQLPILLALATANGVCWRGMLDGDPALASLGLRAGVHAIILLFVLKGGVLTPIFSGNALRELGRGDQAAFLPALEAAAAGSVLLLAALDLGGAPAAWTGAAALACALAQGWRLLRWKGWLLLDVPLVFTMHLGFAWLVLAFLLKAAADLADLVPQGAWLHAFTVGGLGMMMLGLMTRVVLRHTGRPLRVPAAMKLACVLMFLAAMIRLGAGLSEPARAAMMAAATLWGLAFLLYFACFAGYLLGPSLPQRPAGG